MHTNCKYCKATLTQDDRDGLYGDDTEHCGSCDDWGPNGEDLPKEDYDIFGNPIGPAY